MIQDTQFGKRYIGIYIVEAKEITMDKIKELKKAGYYDEAVELFNFFRSDIKETQRRIFLDELKKDKEIKREAGICTIMGCKTPAAEGRAICKYHSDYKKEYQQFGPKKKEKKGPEKVIYCEICKKNIAVDFDNIRKGTTKKWMCRFCNIEGKRKWGEIK